MCFTSRRVSMGKRKSLFFLLLKRKLRQSGWLSGHYHMNITHAKCWLSDTSYYSTYYWVFSEGTHHKECQAFYTVGSIEYYFSCSFSCNSKNRFESKPESTPKSEWTFHNDSPQGSGQKIGHILRYPATRNIWKFGRNTQHWRHFWPQHAIIREFSSGNTQQLGLVGNLPGKSRQIWFSGGQTAPTRWLIFSPIVSDFLVLKDAPINLPS